MLFLDGLRGMAALYVVFHHAFLEQPLGVQAAHYKAIAAVFEFGRLAVDVFIVLSGFCLMIPVARSESGRLSSTVVFLGRRAWRILPPYYGAVLLSLLFVIFVPDMGRRRGVHWDITLPVFTPGVIVSHLLLVHNLSASWVYNINHALWSVATESQIYLLFPFLLLPIWRRLGNVALIALCAGTGIICFYLLPSLHGARPWYVALFAMGMVGADLSESHNSEVRRINEIAPWGWLTCGCVLLAASTALFRATLKRHEWAPDFLVGAVAFNLILYCGASKKRLRETNVALSTFESKFSVLLGLISYSLYLVHPPVIALADICFTHLRLGPGLHLGMMLTVAVGASVSAGWVYHLCVERSFLPKSDPRKMAAMTELARSSGEKASASE